MDPWKDTSTHPDVWEKRAAKAYSLFKSYVPDVINQRVIEFGAGKRWWGKWHLNYHGLQKSSFDLDDPWAHDTFALEILADPALPNTILMLGVWEYLHRPWNLIELVLQSNVDHIVMSLHQLFRRATQKQMESNGWVNTMPWATFLHLLEANTSMVPVAFDEWQGPGLYGHDLVLLGRM